MSLCLCRLSLSGSLTSRPFPEAPWLGVTSRWSPWLGRRLSISAGLSTIPQLARSASGTACPRHTPCVSVSFQPLTRCLDPHPLLGTHVPSQVTHSPPCPLKCLWPSLFTSPFSSLSSFTLKITSHLPSTLTLQNPRNHCCSHMQGWELGVTRRWSVT